MSELKQLVIDLGGHNVQTYIQSGNVILDTSLDQNWLEQAIHKAINKRFNYEVPVMVLDRSVFIDVFKWAPSHDSTFMHFTFCNHVPNNSQKGQKESDLYQACEHGYYVYAPGGYGKTKLNNSFFERLTGMPCTTRNWKTINKLIELSA